MVNPLLLFSARPGSRRPRGSVRRAEVAVPTEVPAVDAVFLVLRRMRVPLIVLVVIFAVSVAGLAIIPGRDAQGNPARMTVFDAFYFISYTATTIGFGELPNAFTTAQRMWVTGSIYGSVIGWAYAIGTLFSLLQDQGFRDALALQQFRRRVRRIDEPFLLVAGYGHAGQLVCQGLDGLGRRAVVLDETRERIEALAADQLSIDVPGLAADVHNPAMLGVAGLGHPRCEGVLALTDDDDANLAVVMAANLVRPGLPVIARCADRAVEEHMHDFAPQAVINPYDRFGGYLVLALRRPTTYRLATWLMSPAGSPLPERREGLADGRWIVCADGQFGEEVTADLRRAGLDVTMADPADGDPDVTGIVGFVAGTERDTTNLSLAAHARLSDPGIYLVARQKAPSSAPLIQALDLDSVFIPTELVARETLARVITPISWSFIDHILQQPDGWAVDTLTRITARVGPRAPHPLRLIVTPAEAPALVRWLARHELALGDVLRDPDDRGRSLAAIPLVLIRGEETTFLPDLDGALRVGDVVLMAGRESAHDAMTATLFYDAAVEYVATGRQVPSTWLWRALRRGGGG